MKRLAVRTPLCDFAGKELTDNTKSGDDKILRIQDILVMYLGRFLQSKDPKEIIRANAVGMKIFGSKTEYLELEDAEFEIIEKAMKDPSQMACPVCRRQAHGPMILSPIYQALEDAKKEVPETPED